MAFDFIFNGLAGLGRILSDAQFFAPRTSSLSLVRGTGPSTLTRATPATVTNNDGFLVTALAGEIAIKGGRRIRNYSRDSESFTTINWSKVDTTAAANQASSPTGTLTADLLYPTTTGTLRYAADNLGLVLPAGTGAYSIYAKAAGKSFIYLLDSAGSGVRAYFDVATGVVGTASGGYISAIEDVGDGWYRCKMYGATTAAGALYVGVSDADNNTTATTSGTNGVYVWGAQLEDVTSQTTQTAGEYVSVGVLSSPWHGAGVDGVKWFDTDISGNPIPASTLKGEELWQAATQYLGVTATPATQTTASLGTGTYTLWCEGTGSCIASAGTATITGAAAASAGAPDQFEVTVAGTVTVTVTGTLTTFNLTNTPYQTPYIANTGAAGTSTTRNAGVDSTPTSGNIIAAAGTIAFEFTPGHAPSGTVYLWGSYVDANNSTSILHDATNLIFRQRIGGVNTDATIALAFVSGTTYKGAVAYGASGQKIAVDGTLGTPHANTSAAQLGATMELGGDGNGGNQAGMAFKMNYILQRQASDSELVAMTA